MKSFELSLPKVIPVGLAYHLALNAATSTDRRLWSDDEICADHSITIEQLESIKLLPEFRREYLTCLKDVKESGDNVRLKARFQFEHYLENFIPALFSDPDAPIAEKNKALVFLGKVAGLADDKAKSTDAVVATVTPSINIILNHSPPKQPDIVINS
jgi:hypothetical protein